MQSARINVGEELKEEYWMNVSHAHDDWDHIDEPHLEVLVTSWHELTCGDVQDEDDLDASGSLAESDG